MIVNMGTIKELVLDVLNAQLVPFLTSSPGIGKSSLAKEIAETNKLKLIDLRLSQMDPADLNGLPFMTDKGKAGYVPMNVFPLEEDSLPDGYKGWLILLDEFNSAPMAVQAAAYKLVLDRKVGVYNLHKKAAIMAAGNLLTDKAIVNRISTAMQSRLIHFTIGVDKDAWIKWADKNNIDYRIKSFIHFKPDALHLFDPNHNEETFPCPRTYEFLSKLIKPYKELSIDKIPLIAGTIGEGMARQFFAFSKIYGELPNIEVIKADPEGVHIADEPSIQYALSGLIAYHLGTSNVDILMKFLKRLNIDLQVIALRSSIARQPDIKRTQPVKEWVRENAKNLM
jgi:hypothetical protein